MSGECKSYRLNSPMTWQEFRSMPDDIKVTYIKLLREKFRCPDSKIGEMMGATKDQIHIMFKKLGLNKGHTRKKTNWDKDGFYAWVNGVDKLPTPVIEEPTEAPVIEAKPVHFYTDEERATIFGEEKGYVEDDLPYEEPDPIQDLHHVALCAEIDALKIRIDELLKSNEELMAVHEKDKAKIAWLKNECDNQRIHARILEAQMEVVRLIFGGKNNG